MSGINSSILNKQPSKTSYQSSPTTASTNNTDKAQASNQPQRQQSEQPGGEYWTSQNTSIDHQSQQTTMSSTTSSRSLASSTRGSSSIDSAKRPLVSSEPRRSSIERAMDKAKSKLGGARSGAETLPNDELEYERQRAKAEEKQRRKEEYERLGLKDRTVYGMPGRVNFNH